MLKQKKGYILLETLVVVGVLSIVLVGMYSSFINMYSIFKERRTFDNTEFLYKTKILREQLTMTADLGSSKIVTICNNNDASNKCENNSEYGGIFKEFGIQYAFFAVANITSGDVNGMTNIPVTVKRYIRDLDTDADSNDVILIVAYQTDEIGYEVASINYSKTAGKKMSEFDKLLSGLDSSSTDVVTKPSPEGETCTNTVAYDGTIDNNLRYVGANPCNYVTFNGETAGWRIVGKMNNVDNGSGKLETRIKLIRSASLGTYSWDASKSGVNGATSNNGINDWSQADLMQELNGDYLNTNLTANTSWYNGTSNSKTGIFDYTKVLKAEAQDKIGDAKWYLGGMKTSSSSLTDLIPSNLYTLERGNKVLGSEAGTCNDGACPRALDWTGKVGIPYPSDYGYATAGGNTTTRSTCIETLPIYYHLSNITTWSSQGYSDCINNVYLKATSSSTWLLSPVSSNAYTAYAIVNSGYVFDYSTGGARDVYPIVYLKSWVKPVEGNGSLSNPYILGF